jgi:hypothetical protein
MGLSLGPRSMRIIIFICVTDSDPYAPGYGPLFSLTSCTRCSNPPTAPGLALFVCMKALLACRSITGPPKFFSFHFILVPPSVTYISASVFPRFTDCYLVYVPVLPSGHAQPRPIVCSWSSNPARAMGYGAPHPLCPRTSPFFAHASHARLTPRCNSPKPPTHAADPTQSTISGLLSTTSSALWSSGMIRALGSSFLSLGKRDIKMHEAPGSIPGKAPIFFFAVSFELIWIMPDELYIFVVSCSFFFVAW